MAVSSRSVPTGPGSRGGHWHEPEYRRAYWRAQNARHRGRVVPLPLDIARPSFTAALRSLVEDEIATTSIRQLGLRLAIDHASVWRWLHEHNDFSADSINALVDYFGMEAISKRRWALYVELRKAVS